MPYGRRRSSFRSLVQASDPPVGMSQAKVIRSPQQPQRSTSKSFRKSQIIVSDASSTASMASSFLANEYKEEHSPSVELKYPSTVFQHGSAPSDRSRQADSIVWQEYEESQKYNRKQMNSTLDTEKSEECDLDDDGLFPYLGRPHTLVAPPELKNRAVTGHQKKSSPQDFEANCVDDTFPYLGHAPFQANETPCKRLDPDGQLARNMCFELPQNDSSEAVVESEEDELNRQSHYYDDELSYLGRRNASQPTIGGDESEDGNEIAAMNQKSACRSTLHMPYMGQFGANNVCGEDEGVKYNDVSVSENVQTPNASRDENLAPDALRYGCRGTPPLSRMSAMEEKKVEEDEESKNIDDEISHSDYVSSNPLSGHVHGQEDFEYSVSSADSRVYDGDGDSEDDQHDSESFKPLHDHVDQCIRSFGAESVPTGQAYLQLGAAYLENGQDLPAALRAFARAHRSFVRKPVARALALEKISQVASLQAKGDASYLSQVHNLLREAVRLRQVHLGGLHADTVNTMNQLARYHRKSGDLQESRKLQGQVYRARRQIYGSLHPSCAVAAHDYANILVELNHLDEAKTFYGVALNIYENMQVPLENPTVSRLIKDIRRMETLETGTGGKWSPAHHSKIAQSQPGMKR
ncbi:hypothetical protein MPSEU_000016300 [Mayamaea pseudoterrestris]|nr:hypothetical protein MPSEU_000016300 [Mayamaea pseudoterrestris]